MLPADGREEALQVAEIGQSGAQLRGGRPLGMVGPGDGALEGGVEEEGSESPECLVGLWVGVPEQEGLAESLVLLPLVGVDVGDRG